MVAIETKNKIIKYLKTIKYSNLTELMIATGVARSFDTMKKIIFKLQDEGIIDIEKEIDEKEYKISLRK